MPLPASAAAFLAGLQERLRRLQPRKRIVFPEGDDLRIIAAAARLEREGLIEPILVGVKPAGTAAGLRYVDPASSPHTARYGALFYERRRSKGITATEAVEAARDPLRFAALMVAAGDADGSVGGAAHSTAEVARAALQCIGTPPKIRSASSFFLMGMHNQEVGHHGLLLMADCAVIVDPSAVELADIALTTAESTRAILEVEPTVAMLSFSTKGSATHKEVSKVVEALRIIRARAPELHVDGEFQADAALLSHVGRSKAPGSTVAGQANTLIFPNLAAGNIGYKLVEALCGAAAMGPIFQGLAKPANDLSRGCSAEDVYGVALITALQSEGSRRYV